MAHLYNDCKSISIFNLMRWGYLKPEQFKSGTVTWSRGGEQTGAITIIVNTDCESPTLRLDYQWNGEPVNYTIELESVQSNLGKGLVWFFICPHTHKRCRKLYLVQKYFYHRSAYLGILYETQTYSHKNRRLGQAFNKLFGVDTAYEQLYKKGFTKYYKGKPTKRYLKVLNQIKAGEGISEEALLMGFI